MALICGLAKLLWVSGAFGDKGAWRCTPLPYSALTPPHLLPPCCLELNFEQEEEPYPHFQSLLLSPTGMDSLTEKVIL